MPPFVKYKVRSGTIDLGKEYESKILALLSLQCLNYSKEDFQLAFNVDGVGDFDDVILFHEKNAFMLQIKHKENSTPITEKEFLAPPTQDFSIRRYLKDIEDLQMKLNSFKANKINSDIFEKLRNCDQIYFLFYTNRNAKYCTFLDETENIDKDLYYLKSISNSRILKFNLAKFSSYFEFNCENPNNNNFYVFCNQIFAKDIDKRIEDEIERIVKTRDIKTIGEAFIKFISDWGKGNLGGHYCLTKQNVTVKLSELLFKQYEVRLLEESYSFYECEHKFLWNELIKDKTITLVDANIDQRAVFQFLLQYIGSEVKKYCNVVDKQRWSSMFSQDDQNLFYTNCEELKFYMLRSIGNRGKITLYDVYKCLCNAKRLPLLLEVNKKEQYEHIIEILKLFNCAFNIIIVSKFGDDISTNKNILSYFQSLQDLKEEHKEKILAQQIKLQVRAKVKLKDLIDATMFTYIKVIDIINILTDNFNIGEESNNVPSYYIQRRFSKICIDLKALKRITNDIFLVEDTTNYFERIAKRENLNVHFLNEIVFENLNDYHVIIYYEQDKCKNKKLFSSEKNIHHLVYHSTNYLEWKRSSGSIRNIKNYQDESVNIFESNMDFFANPVTIISAAPGMGKSLLIDYIAKSPIGKWILRIDLNRYQDYYENDNCKHQEASALEHLNHFRSQSNTELDNKVFKKLLINKDVIVLLDGFDEISISYTQEVTNIAKSLVKDGFHIWLTTRPLMKSYLEDEFNTFALSLIPFTEENQTQFLIKYFSGSNNNLPTCSASEELLNAFIKKLLVAFKKNINDHDAHFTSTPLHVRLLADAFTDEFDTFLFNKGKKRFNEDFDLLDLYCKFIKKKIRILCDKFGLGSKDLCIVYKDFQSLHALKLLFPHHASMIDKYLSDIYKYNKHSIQLLQKEGVLTVDEGFNINFVHRTFAEYLAAEWLSQNLNNKDEEIKNITKVLITERFKQTYKFLFDMLDGILVKGCRLHMVVMKGQVNEALEILNSKPNDIIVRDKARRTILHILALYKIQYPLLVTICPLVIEKMYNEMPNMETDLFGYTPLDYALENRSFNISNLMCERWKTFKINIHIDAKLQKKYLQVAFSNYKSLFDSLLSYFVYKDVLLRNVDTKELVIIYLKRFEFYNDYGFKKYEGAQIFNILNLEKFIQDSDICHEIIFGCKKNIESLLVGNKKLNVKDINGNTPLHYAILHEKLEVIHLLLMNGADIDFKNTHDETPLHIAVQYSYDKIIEILVQHKANLNIRNENGNTPLHTAILKNQPKIVDFLIRRGADVNVSNYGGCTCIHLLITNNLDDILHDLLSRGIYNDKKNISGETPLYLALTKRKLKVAKLLISLGSDVNSKTNYNKSIVSAAVDANDIDIVKQIISANGNFNAVHDSTLYLAVKNDNIEMMKLLLSSVCNINAVNDYKRTVLHIAVKDLKKNAVEAILNCGALINKCDSDGNTPLHLVLIQASCHSRLPPYASISERKIHFDKIGTDTTYFVQDTISIARLLISKGADVNIINSSGKTPIHYIIRNDLTELIFEILENRLGRSLKIVFNIKDDLGNTILHNLIVKNNFDCVKSIVSKTKTIINEQNNEGETPLHLATKLCQLKTVEFLLQNNADINIKDVNGCTALHTATVKKNLLILKRLLELDNVSVNEPDQNGKTLLHLAADNNFKEAVISILECDGDINVCDNNGNTALHLAAEKDLSEIVKVLFDHKPDIDICNNNNKSAQSLAYERGNDEIIYLFQKYCVESFCTIFK